MPWKVRIQFRISGPLAVLLWQVAIQIELATDPQLASPPPPSPSAVSGAPVVTPQPTLLNTLYSYLENSHCLAAPPGEVDCLGVLSALRRMGSGQWSLHVLEMGCFGREFQGPGLLVGSLEAEQALRRLVPLALKIPRPLRAKPRAGASFVLVQGEYVLAAAGTWFTSLDPSCEQGI